MATLYTILFALVMLLISTGQGFAQWVSTYGPTGNDFIRVQCFNKIGANLFAGTLGDGVWISTNNSASDWIKISTGLTGKNVAALLTDGTNLIAGTDSGAFLSTNNGTNWTAVNNGLPNAQVSSLALIGTNLFAATFGGGVFLSTNNGSSWTGVNNGLPTFISSLAAIGTDLFAANAGFGGGVYLSTNNGTSWVLVNTGLTGDNVTALVASGTNLFAASFQGSSVQVFISTNNGTNWSLANNGLPNGFEVHFAVSGTNVFAGAYSNGVYLTTDNGANWNEVNEGFGTSRTIRSLAVLGDDLFAGFYSGDVRRRPLAQMITAVDDHNDILFEFNLAQNYPNPFNPSTKIRYSIPRRSSITLKVYDVFGTEVATLVNEEKSAGSYEVTFSAIGGSASGGNAYSLSSGIYFYKLQTGSFVETKKLTLIK